MIDEATAHQICRILDKEMDSDFFVDPMLEETFVGYLGRNEHVEWRLFIAQGIKFRTSPGWPDGERWYVDCYREEKTPRLLRQIERANRRLALLRAKVGR